MVVLLGVLTMSALLLSACGGDDDDGSTTATATTGGNGAAVNEIDQNNLAFKPDKLTIKAGEDVLFLNSETAIHTVNINGKNESGTMKKGDELRWTFTNAGEYKITCDFHPQMKATITVTG
jgi:plastocyanin